MYVVQTANIQNCGIPSQAETPRESRFVPNKVKNAWIISQLTARGAIVQKKKILEATCDNVAWISMRRYGAAGRNGYMSNKTKANVKYINSVIHTMPKKVEIDKDVQVDPEEPPAPCIRPGCKEGGCSNC